MMAQCNDETERKAAYDTKSSETRQEICTTTDSDVHTLVMRQSIRIIRYNWIEAIIGLSAIDFRYFESGAAR